MKHNCCGRIEQVKDGGKLVRVFAKGRSLGKAKPTLWIYQSVIKKYFDTPQVAARKQPSVQTRLDADSTCTSTSCNPCESGTKSLAVCGREKFGNYGVREKGVQVGFGGSSGEREKSRSSGR
eukprot:TRINITY_DN16859_c0_g2_i3.p1 TRINITY_DN16859_c0_g2~~TRINITY_DN16859_c0_g2_i3.p1  ORF type:complete len:122 (+),score=19.67 TRINITY_DN16859_c0_g2_i3:75-440(+)